MTAEEFYIEKCKGIVSIRSKKECIELMEEYAKQQAIQFAICNFYGQYDYAIMSDADKETAINQFTDIYNKWKLI